MTAMMLRQLPTNDPIPTVTDDEAPIVDTDSRLDGALAFTATRSSDFASGRIDRLTLTDGISVNGSYPATLSDIRVATDGDAIYQIGRFNIDSLTRFDANDTSVVDFQFSVNGEEIAILQLKAKINSESVNLI